MRYMFADCILDETRHELVRGGAVVPVEPQVFDLLLLLAGNAGRLVSRDEIIDAVWGGRIVSESAISARIAAARKAVGDDGQTQRVIRTVARRGLMMAVAVETVADADSAAGMTRPGQRIRFARSESGRAIAYAVTGEGRPLLRFGPSMTMDLEAEWRIASERRFIDDISRRHRLLRFNHVGSGQSDRNNEKLSHETMAREALAVADAAGFDRFAAFSESGGVFPALHFAARYPDRVSRLIIVGGYVDGRVRRSGTKVPDTVRAMIDAGWGDPDSAFATAFLTAYFPEGPLDAVREIVRMMQAACPQETMLEIRDLVNNATVEHLLDKVRCPVLVVHGRDDGIHPLSEARKLASGLPDAELMVLETANHMPLHGNAEYPRYLAAFLNFLARAD